MKVKPSKKQGKVVVELKPSEERLLTQAGKGSETAPSPFRLQKILVPLDLSACSLKALQYAIPFAKQFHASLTLLYVVQLNYAVGDLGAIDITPLEGEMCVHGEDRLQTLLAEEVRGEVPAEALVRTGLAVTEIVAAAESLQIDLIIMATHGYTGLKHVLLGSTAENVLRHAPCPVLVVREQEREFISR